MPYKHLPKQFEGIVETTEYRDPKIDIGEEVDEFIEGVTSRPQEEQEHMVKEYIEDAVPLALNTWKTGYRQNDEIIKNMENHHTANEKKIDTHASNIEELTREKESIKSEKYSDEKELKKLKKRTNNKEPYKKFTIVFFLIGAFALALLTLSEFSHAMSALNEALSGEKATTSTVVVFAFGAAGLLMGGKLVAVLYEYINYNRIFFISIISAALVMIGVSAYVTATGKAFADHKMQVSQDINKTTTKLATLMEDDDYDERDDDGELTESSKLIAKKIKTNQQALDSNMKKEVELKNQAIGLNQNMILLILLTELFIGGVIWMYITDYSRRTNKNKTDHEIAVIEGHMENMDAEINKKESEIEDEEEKIEHLRLENHDLHRVVSLIKTEEEIDSIENRIIGKETKKALSKLWKANKDT